MNKVLYNIDQRNDTTDAQKETAHPDWMSERMNLATDGRNTWQSGLQSMLFDRS